jgi:hypothetical protein
MLCDYRTHCKSYLAASQLPQPADRAGLQPAPGPCLTHTAPHLAAAAAAGGTNAHIRGLLLPNIACSGMNLSQSCAQRTACIFLRLRSPECGMANLCASAHPSILLTKAALTAARLNRVDHARSFTASTTRSSLQQQTWIHSGVQA